MDGARGLDRRASLRRETQVLRDWVIDISLEWYSVFGVRMSQTPRLD